MDKLSKIDVVVAKLDERGRGVFVDAEMPATHFVEGTVEAAYVWGTDSVPALPSQVGGRTMD